MIIEWDTDLYRRVRSNFMQYHDMDRYPLTSSRQIKHTREIFRKELEKNGAVLLSKINEKYIGEYVTDSLGMCFYYDIKFSSEKQYTWFVLKWS